MGGGTITMQNDPAQIRKDFEYAKTAGFPLIFVSPDPAALDTIEQIVKEFDIKLAIHNHGRKTSGSRGPRTRTTRSRHATHGWASAWTSATRAAPAPIREGDRHVQGPRPTTCT